MPTNTNAYNSRVTDESLEKRFRDTFKSQGGAALVDDLYAQGVIVPVVDFTAAATGENLAENLQTAWDFSTGHTQVTNASSTIISNSGFWQIDLTATIEASSGGGGERGNLALTDGLSTKKIWSIGAFAATSDTGTAVDSDKFVVFLRSGDSVVVTSGNNASFIAVSYRQIATVNGDLVNPSGFTSS